MSKRFNIKPPVWPKEYTFQEFVKLNPHIINENQLISLYNQYLNKYLTELGEKKIHFKQSTINQLLTELKDLKFDQIMSIDTLGGGIEKNYALQFTGDTNSDTRRGDLVVTDFNPDTYNLNLGFTISYWVRPDELGNDMFAIGRKAHNNERFTFGISTATKGYFAVGSNQSERSWETMLDTAGIDKATHLTLDGSDWKLTIGRWYHFAVTYADRENTDSAALRKVYMNGQQIWGTGVSDPTYAGNINWSQTGNTMDHNLSFGMRAVRGSGTNTNHNNGWACGLDEVAIYNTEKEANWVSSVYQGATNYDHTGADNLVGYWRFNEGSGTIAKDSSRNENHGTLTNDSIGADGGAAFASGIPTWIASPNNYNK